VLALILSWTTVRRIMQLHWIIKDSLPLINDLVWVIIEVDLHSFFLLQVLRDEMWVLQCDSAVSVETLEQ